MNNPSAESLTLDLALIGFVEDTPRHGYEIYQLLSGTPELWRIWRVKQSRLYAMLARLEGAGLLQADTVAQAGRPARKLLWPTATGLAAFQRWRTQPVAQPREMRLAFMLKLYFALRAGPETAQRLVVAQQIAGERWGDLPPDPAEGPFLQAVAAYRRAHIAAIRGWLASLTPETLRANGPTP